MNGLYSRRPIGIRLVFPEVVHARDDQHELSFKPSPAEKWAFGQVCRAMVLKDPLLELHYQSSHQNGKNGAAEAATSRGAHYYLSTATLRRLELPASQLAPTKNVSPLLPVTYRV